MLENALAQMGVYAVTIVVMGIGFRWIVGQVAKAEARIEAKDEVILKMLPVLVETQHIMQEVARTSQDLAKTATDLAKMLAVVQDRNRGA